MIRSQRSRFALNIYPQITTSVYNGCFHRGSESLSVAPSCVFAIVCRPAFRVTVAEALGNCLLTFKLSNDSAHTLRYYLCRRLHGTLTQHEEHLRPRNSFYVRKFIARLPSSERHVLIFVDSHRMNPAAVPYRGARSRL